LQPPLPFAAADDYARTVMGWAREPLPDTVTVEPDVAYGPHRLQRCNVFAPRAALASAASAPVLVFWHGGGWTNGYRGYTTFMAPHVVALGMVLIAPSYRLAPEHPLPAACDDALSSLAHLGQHLPQWGGAADRVYLSGHSAGGHLAALTALRVAQRSRAGIADNMIKGCLPISGIMDLHTPNPVPGNLEEKVYTTVLRGRHPLLDTVLSPLYWAAGNRPPFCLGHGEKDSPRAIKSNHRLAALLQTQPGKVNPGPAPPLAPDAGPWAAAVGDARQRTGRGRSTRATPAGLHAGLRVRSAHCVVGQQTTRLARRGRLVPVATRAANFRRPGGHRHTQ